MLTRKQNALLLIAAFLATITFIMLRVAPIHYNPDANAYFGMALRMARGDFRGAVHLMHSPLLSFLIGIFIWLGFSIPTSYQLVNSLTIAATFLLTFRVAEASQLATRSCYVAAALTTIQLLPFSLMLITPDILVVPIVLGVLLYLHRFFCTSKKLSLYIAGLLMGIGYLAKSFQLPIFTILLSTMLFQSLNTPKKRFLHRLGELLPTFVTLGLVSAPWILAISLKSGIFMVSGQQAVLSGAFDLLAYHPDLSPETLQNHSLGKFAGHNLINQLFELVSINYPNRLGAIAEVSTQFLNISFGIPAGFLFVAAVLTTVASARVLANSPEQRCMRSLFLIYSLVHIALYLIVGSGHSRFYLPMLPILSVVLMHATGATRDLTASIQLKLINTKDRALYSAIAISVITIFIITPIINCFQIIRRAPDPFVEEALSMAALHQDTGPLIGNLEQPLTGYVAYLLNRESWGYLTAFEVSTPVVREKLYRWGITQVLWSGEYPQALARFPFLKQIDSREHSSGKITLFQMIRDNTDESTLSEPSPIVTAVSPQKLN